MSLQQIESERWLSSDLPRATAKYLFARIRKRPATLDSTEISTLRRLFDFKFPPLFTPLSWVQSQMRKRVLTFHGMANVLVDSFPAALQGEYLLPPEHSEPVRILTSFHLAGNGLEKKSNSELEQLAFSMKKNEWMERQKLSADNPLYLSQFTSRALENAMEFTRVAFLLSDTPYRRTGEGTWMHSLRAVTLLDDLLLSLQPFQPSLRAAYTEHFKCLSLLLAISHDWREDLTKQGFEMRLVAFPDDDAFVRLEASVPLPDEKNISDKDFGGRSPRNDVKQLQSWIKRHQDERGRITFEHVLPKQMAVLFVQMLDCISAPEECCTIVELSNPFDPRPDYVRGIMSSRLAQAFLKFSLKDSSVSLFSDKELKAEAFKYATFTDRLQKLVSQSTEGLMAALVVAATKTVDRHDNFYTYKPPPKRAEQDGKSNSNHKWLKKILETLLFITGYEHFVRHYLSSLQSDPDELLEVVKTRETRWQLSIAAVFLLMGKRFDDFFDPIVQTFTTPPVPTKWNLDKNDETAADEPYMVAPVINFALKRNTRKKAHLKGGNSWRLA